MSDATPFTGNKKSTAQFLEYIRYLKESLIALREYVEETERVKNE